MGNRKGLKWCTLLAVVGVLISVPPKGALAGDKPNIVVVFTDDQGFGDL